MLHHGDRVSERLQVEDEIVALPTVWNHRARSSISVVGRRLVAVLRGQLDHVDDPQAAVEVVVQQHLRRPLQAGGVDHVEPSS